MQALERRCNALATERDNLREALSRTQHHALPPQSSAADMQLASPRDIPGNDATSSGEPLDLGSDSGLSVHQEQLLKGGASESGQIRGEPVLQKGQLAGTQGEPGMLEQWENASQEVAVQNYPQGDGETPSIQLPGEQVDILNSLAEATGPSEQPSSTEQQLAPASGRPETVPPQIGASAVPPHPYLNVESVLAMEAFSVVERAALFLNVPTFEAEFISALTCISGNDSCPPPAHLTVIKGESLEASDAPTGPAAGEAPIIGSAAHQKVQAENVRLLAELEGARQEALEAVEGEEGAAWQLQQVSWERRLLRSAVQELEDSLRQHLAAQELQAAPEPAADAPAQQPREQGALAQLVSSLLGHIDLLAVEKSALQEQLDQSRQAEAAAAERIEEISSLQEDWSEQLSCLEDERDFLMDVLHESDARMQESQQTVSEQDTCMAIIQARLGDEEEHAAELCKLLVAQAAAETSLLFQTSALEREVCTLQDQAADYEAFAADLAAECGEARSELADRSEREAAMADHFACQLASSNEDALLLQQALSEAHDRVQECRAEVAAQDAAISQLTSVLREAEEHGAALSSHIVALEAAHTALISQLSEAERETERLQDELLNGNNNAHHSRSGGVQSSAVQSTMPGGASLEAALARSAALRAQLAESERRTESLEAQILDLAATVDAPWAATASEDAGEGTAQLHVLAAAAEDLRGVHGGSQELNAALEDVKVANARNADLAARLEDSQRRREALQAQVMDLAAAESARAWRPVTPAGDDARRSDVPGTETALESPVATPDVPSAAADVPVVAQYTEAGLESFDAHPQPPPGSKKELRREVPSGLYEELEAAQTSIAALQTHLADSEQQRAAMELQLVALSADSQTKTAPHLMEAEIKVPSSESSGNEATIKAHYGTRAEQGASPIPAARSWESKAVQSRTKPVAETPLGAADIAAQCEFLEDDSAAAQFFEAISISGTVEIPDYRQLPLNLCPGDLASATTSATSDEQMSQTAEQLAKEREEVCALQTALSQGKAVFIEVESQLHSALEQEARLELSLAAAEERLQQAQAAAADAEALQGTLQQQLLEEHERSGKLEAQLAASAAPVHLVIR